MGIIKDGYEKFRKDGTIEFLKSSIKHIHSTLIRRLSQLIFDIKVKVSILREKLILSVNDVTAIFVTDNEVLVRGTLSRYKIEYNILDEIIEDLREEDVFYDIGANTGLYTCIAGKKGANVIAFEPYPPNISKLRKNVHFNDVDADIHEVALSDTSGKVGFSVPDVENPNYPTSGESGYGEGKITSEAKDTEVPSVRADDLIDSGVIEPPNIVKIDVEGAEQQVIDGMKSALANDRCRAVFCEIHSGTKQSEQITPGDYHSNIVDSLKNLGFDKVENCKDPGKYIIAKK